MRRASAALVILGGSLGGPALAASGGPDTYGYTWRDSAEPGVTFAWEDISATGMDITISEDDANTGFLPLSFGFPYYGVSYSRIAACTNGWVSPVDAVSEEWGNAPLPDPFEPSGTIAAFWDDLDLVDMGRMLFQDFGDRAVVSWLGVPYHLGAGERLDFQVVLHADGRIVMQYLDVDDRGSATIGIESPDDTDGLTAWDETPIAGVSYAIWFEPPVPVPVDLDCAGATPLACGARTTGDTRSGAANQDAYRCAPGDWSGRETVHVLDVPAGGSLRLILQSLSGDQALIVVTGCDPNACVARAGDDVTLTGVSGTVQVVVDSAPGMEGSYAITVECSIETLPFCGGPEPELQPDPWGDATGSWLVHGWIYHDFDTSNFALRVDGGPAYQHDGLDCPGFATTDFGVLWPSGPAFVTWGAPEGSVEMRMRETTAGGCCGLLVDVEVTNTDAVPHSYEFRVYHDTAFGDEDPAGACGGGGIVDGGEIEVMGTRYGNEVELLPLGGDTCEGQVRMFSADFPTELRASYEMLGPNLPVDMEFLEWDDGGLPCTDWSDLVDGTLATGCNDNSLLLIWRFPQGAGTLAPGESAIAQYRIGWNCAWPCSVACESPVLPPAMALDVGPCNDGIEVGWAAATFPGAGNGVYHVYRSDSSFVDALAQPPLTGPTGTTDARFVDDTTLPGIDYYYVVQAESTDFPGCGSGPLVAGSTAEAQAGPVRDDADLAAPVTEVGNALRAVGHTDVTVDFTWPTAPSLGANESYVILRSDDRPQGPFSQAASVAAPAWTDPDAPPRYSPTHVWFYDVRIADSCGNLSRD